MRVYFIKSLTNSFLKEFPIKDEIFKEIGAIIKEREI